ncbi:hypothetical protein OC834_001526 [Tilletia horrida]|uniref:PhoD-like phosphatase domain-containing protein n=1 Tax=Tilletia horrida TaxID=155126 RepID=A0AAN6JK16_9BASI|nr:hypothetical protein OC842_004303 [Tilletia horrida]KAK0535410.1 hypothetical protein OC834_001526 [Tilletia horrida]KAK0538080.1 hypothetical protein OC835_001537 [Tilletia horrida]KAK0565532.1 hypothetical protein OC844_001186 [Tilletia horrida]
MAAAPHAEDAQHDVPSPRAVDLEHAAEGNIGGGAQAAYAIRTGPMLRYDTTEPDADFLYHAFALIVTADKHSDPAHTPEIRYHTARGEERTIRAARIFQFDNHTFWRFKFEFNLTDKPTKITYELLSARFLRADIQDVDFEDGNEQPDDGNFKNTVNDFHVPARDQTFRWAAHSCNGFSDVIKPEEWGGADPLWNDLLEHHARDPFHAVVGGGDQIYCDKLTKEPELKDWVEASGEKSITMPLTDEIAKTIDRFYMRHYCSWFGGGAFSRTIARIPMINMLDDHDLIDGFGTYKHETMLAPIFNTIGSRGYFWYLLFQQFIAATPTPKEAPVNILDEPKMTEQALAQANATVGEPVTQTFRSLILGYPGTYVPYRNHTFLTYLGPKQQLLLMDCRAERKLDQVVSPEGYGLIFSEVRKRMPSTTEHLTILVGVPLAYPRMVFLERTLSSSANPLLLLAKAASKGFTNKFDGQVELLDDLMDHWCAAPHKRERNRLIARTEMLALERHVRISWLSGDVHAGGVGVFYGYHAHDSSLDPKYQLAVITSAIVNAPPPPTVIGLLNRLATKKHRSLFYLGVKESMVPLFEEDPQGNKSNTKYIWGGRNWCAVTHLPATGELEFDLRIEKEKGQGVTKGYAVRAPAPKWAKPAEEHTGRLEELSNVLEKELLSLRSRFKEKVPGWHHDENSTVSSRTAGSAMALSNASDSVKRHPHADPSDGYDSSTMGSISRPAVSTHSSRLRLHSSKEKVRV